MTGWLGNGGLPEGYRNYLRVRVGPGEPQVSIRSWPLPAEQRPPDPQPLPAEQHAPDPQPLPAEQHAPNAQRLPDA
jgi:hypothetical protein